MTNVEGAILVGGRSRRMGRDKSTLVLRNRLVVDRIADAMVHWVRRVRLVGGSEPETRRTAYRRQEDIYPGRGPLSGIHASLATAEQPVVLVVGCDLPFVTESFLRGIAAGLTDEFEAVVPRESGRPVPVCAAYRSSCVAVLEERLARGDVVARDFATSLRTKWMEGSELKRLDPKGVCLRNINTPCDYEQALQIAAAEE